MKTDIVTVVIFVFCLGVLVTAVDLPGLFSSDDEADNTVVLQQAS